tara:strand:+ start:892 stop:1941 length:1050 start_codon:yes stop_codon:yes gene_type:complete
MNTIALTEALQERGISFTLFSYAMKQNNLAPSQGWDLTIARITSELANPKSTAAYEAGIKRIYSDLMYYGSKVARFYISKDAAKVRAVLDKHMVPDTQSFGKSFPLPLPGPQLRKASVNPSCVFMQSLKSGSTYIFCSRQFLIEREKLPDDSLEPQVVKDYGDFDEVIGIRKRWIQLFDVVLVNDKTGVVELRMDGYGRQSLADIEKRLDWLVSTINAQLAALGKAYQLKGSINFFPKIAELYDAADGRISELEHATDTAGIHKGKTRKKKADFRQDSFHSAAASTAGTLHAYAVSKCWDSPTGVGFIDLKLPGTLRCMATTSTPVVDVACILNCASETDYSFILSKLL